MFVRLHVSFRVVHGVSKKNASLLFSIKKGVSQVPHEATCHSGNLHQGMIQPQHKTKMLHCQFGKVRSGALANPTASILVGVEIRRQAVKLKPWTCSTENYLCDLWKMGFNDWGWNDHNLVYKWLTKLRYVTKLPNWMSHEQATGW